MNVVTPANVAPVHQAFIGITSDAGHQRKVTWNFWLSERSARLIQASIHALHEFFSILNTVKFFINHAFPFEQQGLFTCFNVEMMAPPIAVEY
ncbi:hypothetical protein AB182_14975 [Phytobacter ursingii]|uniref:Uncharacterized protein n=1 Tax=Phytobacter ursingii TaxID=1972431 RepID=A0AAC8QPD8_9ENTR|nr:hypothetical protein AB182_14975 [Phytobacter ursingii]